MVIMSTKFLEILTEIKKYLKEDNYKFLRLIDVILKISKRKKNYYLKDKLYLKKFHDTNFAVYTNREIHSHIYFESFEPFVTKIILDLVKENDICLDVGANIGFYSCLIGKRIGLNGRIYAFEPVDYNIRNIELNKSLNGLKNIKIINKGLGDKNEIKELNIFPEESMLTAHNSFVMNETLSDNIIFKKKNVEIITVDDWIYKEEIKKVDFVKVDIEGYEYFFFHGAKNLLKMSPIIIFEHNIDRLKKLKIIENDFKSLFSNYSTYFITENGLIKYNFDGMTQSESNDILAIPKNI